MSEADRVPSPAAPPAVVAAAPEEKKGKEPEREKLPPIVSAGAGAAAVGAGRGPGGGRGAPRRRVGRGSRGALGPASPPGTPGPMRGKTPWLPFLWPKSELCLLGSRDHFASSTFHPREMPG